MPTLEIRNCKLGEFFQELRNETETYEEQPFFVSLDGKIVSKLFPPGFKLWPRTSGCCPVIVGNAAQVSDDVVVVWHHRPPFPGLFHWIFYLFLLVKLLETSCVAGYVTAAVTTIIWAGVIWLYRRLNRYYLEEMKMLLSCCGTGVLAQMRRDPTGPPS